MQASAAQPQTALAPRILLIDDDDFVAVSLRHYLTARGCDVVTATDRRTAESCLSDGVYDLVLLDPYMTGEAARDSGSLLQSVREFQPSARIVLVSAYISPQVTAAAAALGAVAVLTKPQPVVFLSQLVISVLRMQTEPNKESHCS